MRVQGRLSPRLGCVLIVRLEPPSLPKSKATLSTQENFDPPILARQNKDVYKGGVYQSGVRIQGEVFLSRANYGDGVFETMRSHQGRLPLVELHLQRLARGLAVIGLAAINIEKIRFELQHLASLHPNAVIKLIAISAAPGGSYLRQHNGVEHALVVSALPPSDSFEHPEGIVVRVCKTRLAQNSSLSGIKHLNRGEQILAANEANAHAAQEGLMLDSAGLVICGLSGNVFAVLDGQLCTPIIDGAGVNGVMRACIMHLCAEMGIALSVKALPMADILRASELFLCNAVRAVRPVARLIEECGSERLFARAHPITQRIITELNRLHFAYEENPKDIHDA